MVAVLNCIGNTIYLLILFIYLFIVLFGCTLRHVGSSFPDQGLNLAPLALEV